MFVADGPGRGRWWLSEGQGLLKLELLWADDAYISEFRRWAEEERG